ncbi:MAG: hypothetical protein ACYDDA_07155 [Acidiferrobacteraceae bacterium]
MGTALAQSACIVSMDTLWTHISKNGRLLVWDLFPKCPKSPIDVQSGLKRIFLFHIQYLKMGVVGA